MSNDHPAGSRLADPIKLVCWAGIVAYVVWKILTLAQGATLREAFDFGNPSLAGLGIGACSLGLILRSPKIRRSATLIEPNESRAVAISFLFVFIVMASYYFLRPVRDSLASEWTNPEITQLWNIQFFFSAALVAAYGWACSRIRFKLLVPAVYTFYAATFIAFGFGASLFIGLRVPLPFGWSFVIDSVLIDKSFYVWVSLFSLFHLSVFWSFMADTFSQEQSKRLFAFIAAGASAGAAAGPLVVAVLAEDIGNQNLMLMASALLVVTIPLVFYLQRLKTTDLHNQDVQVDLAAAKMGGKWWAGFGDFVRNPYLLSIGIFILLYTGISAFIYFEQTELLRIYEEREQRTTILAVRDAVVNILTFGLGLFVTGRLVTRLGMPITLALLPLLAVLGFAILAMAPILVVLLAVDIGRRAGNYGVTRPAREMLFTSVSREARFKSKPVVDVVIYRGGDAYWANVFTFLSTTVGFGFVIMSMIGAGLAAIWAASGFYLGRAFNRRETRADMIKDASADSPREVTT